MSLPIPRTPIQEHSRSLGSFARKFMGITLRPYQLEAAQAVLDSIHHGAGRSIVIMFARQSGKDELSANLKAYLLSRLNNREAGIVEVNPTYKPQTINAMERLEARLSDNPLTRKRWRKRSDFMRFVGRARVSFLSGDAEANVVGAVASLLLIVNEAQDVAPSVYDRKFAPMAASTNATRLFMGTAWTSHTLLARELRAARLAEQADGIRRLFLYDAEDVRAVVPAYGAYVDEQVARLGRGHPLIKTQYFNEEIDAQAGMFTPARRAMMQCDAVDRGDAGAHVFALDVAGQDEAAFHNPDEQMLRNPGRDSVSLTIAAVDLSAMDTLQAPIFRIVRRVQWTGLNHLAVFGKLSALADQWRPQHIVVDATGVGEGLWALLDKRYPTRVLPVKFSAQKKSEIGYRFLAMIETGRLRDCSAGISGAISAGPPPSHVVASEAKQSPRASGVLSGAISAGPPPSHVVASEAKQSPRASGSASGAISQSGAGVLSGEVEGEAQGTRPAGHDGRPSTSLRSAQGDVAVSSTITRADVDRQYAACISEVLLGPQRTMRWGVPEGTRDENGELIHDDILMADALLAEADALEWSVTSPTLIVRPRDPLEEMSHFRA